MIRIGNFLRTTIYRLGMVINSRKQCGDHRLTGFSSLSYVQGQYGDLDKKNTREYFYFINDEGYLFLDDTKHKNFTSCFKDKEFLKFFFDRLQNNFTDRYTDDFRFLSRCGYERNYVRASDVPIVYTDLLDNGRYISYNHGHKLMSIKFNPEDICMCTETGRVYYPTLEKYGTIGLIRSKLSFELSKHFIFDKQHSSNSLMKPSSIKSGIYEQPIAIKFNDKTYEISNLLRPLLIDRQHHKTK